jgi:urea transport system permease protein
MSLFLSPTLVKSLFVLTLCTVLSTVVTSAPLASEDELNNVMALDDAWKTLNTKNYAQKARAIEAIVHHNPPEALNALSALLEGHLYVARQDNQLYIMLEDGDNYEFTPLFGGDPITKDRKRGFKKVRINNRIRILIRQSLASMQLEHADAAVRLAAVQELLKQPDSETTALIEPLIQDETDSGVLAAMRTLVAITQLENDDQSAQEEAIETLSESLNPSALNALVGYQAPNKDLENKARAAIRKINGQRDLYAKAETVFFGLSLGSVLALSAIGLAITFGVMGVINMAHGELMMIGAYTTYVIQLLMPHHIGASIIVAIPAAFIVSALVGIAIERGVIRHLYGRPLETLLATFGISLILQQLVRSIFSPLNRSVETPEWMAGAWQFNEVFALTWNRFYIIIFSLAVFVTLIMVMKKTTLGLQVRAVSQNRTMARAMGVRSEWVDALTFGLGSGIAGMAGVALSLLTNVGPNLGQSYIIDSFMVVVFGGVGNLWGTLIAGMSLGVINKVLEPWAGAVLAKILVLIFIILFIQKRPKGLFPQRGRAAED